MGEPSWGQKSHQHSHQTRLLQRSEDSAHRVAAVLGGHQGRRGVHAVSG